MDRPGNPSKSFGGQALEGVFTLLVGVFVQLFRVIALGWLKIARGMARSTCQRRSVQMGQRMAEAGLGNPLLLQKLNGLPAGDREREVVFEELGTSGLETGVPLLGMEAEYAEGRRAFEAARTAERRHDAVAARIWPAHVIGRIALVVNYLLTLAAAILLFAYIYPNVVPERLAALVGKGKPAEPPTPPAPILEVPGLTVTLKRAAVRRGEVKIGPDAVAVDENLSFYLTLTITNTGKTPINYRTWRGKFTSLQDKAARLVDDRGHNILGIVYKGDATPPGGVSTAVIAPGESVEDLIEFGPPEPKFASFDLFLPGENVGRPKETLRLVIPAAVVEVPASFK